MDSSAIDWMKVNGRLVGETALVALSAGVRDVPVIFLSGDEAACREAEVDVPGITTAAVKRGISSNVEIALTAPAARKLINTNIREAVKAHRLKPVRPLRWSGPYRLEIRWKTTQGADLMAHQLDCERVDDQTVCFRSRDILDVLLNRHRPPASHSAGAEGVSEEVMPEFAASRVGSASASPNA